MANIGMEHLMYLFVLHATLTFGAEADLIGETQVGESQEFVNTIGSGEVTESADIGNQEGLTDQISLAVKSIPIIGEIYNLFTTPYGLIINSAMPDFIKTLLAGIFGIIELSIIVGFIRGVDF